MYMGNTSLAHNRTSKLKISRLWLRIGASIQLRVRYTRRSHERPRAHRLVFGRDRHLDAGLGSP